MTGTASCLARSLAITAGLGLGLFVWYVGAFVAWGTGRLGQLLIPVALALAIVLVLEEYGLPRVRWRVMVIGLPWLCALRLIENWSAISEEFGLSTNQTYFLVPWSTAFLVALVTVAASDGLSRARVATHWKPGVANRRTEGEPSDKESRTGE